MKKIFYTIIGIWAFLLFITSIFIALVFLTPCLFLKEPKRIQYFQKVCRVWMTIFLYAIGCPVTVINKEVFQKGENYIITCNHNSFFDVFAATPFLPNPNKSIAKIEMTKIPIFSWIYTIGSVLVDRKDKNSRINSYSEMKKVLNMGIDMLIYPEGTRNKTSKPLKDFYNGAFKLSVETQKPIMPVVIFNTKEILPPHQLLQIKPHKIYLKVLPPIYPQKKTEETLKQEVFQAMWQAYEAGIS